MQVIVFNTTLALLLPGLRRASRPPRLSPHRRPYIFPVRRFYVLLPEVGSVAQLGPLSYIMPNI